MFTQNKLAEVGSFAIGGLIVGYVVNEFLLHGVLNVDLITNTVAVVAGGIIGIIVGFLPKGN